MTLEEENGKDLAQLYAGGVPVRITAEHTGGEEIVTDNDIERIEAIIKYNSFSGDIDDIFTSNKHIAGLWLLPAHLNHSCMDCNCKWNIYGDFIFIRAFKPISKGEELLISYVSPDMEYGKRVKTFQDLGFKCDCSLCELDQADSEKVQSYRKELLQLFEAEKSKTGSERRPEILSKIIQELTNLRPADPKLNVYLIKPLTKLAEWNFELDKYEKAAKLFERAYDLVKGTVFCINAVQFILLNLIASYIQQGDHDKAHEWAAQLKKETKIVYGDSIEFASELYELFSAPAILHTVEWIKGNLIPI